MELHQLQQYSQYLCTGSAGADSKRAETLLTLHATGELLRGEVQLEIEEVVVKTSAIGKKS